jgi:hypothetical protein
VTTVGDHPQRRPQAARVVECVVDRQLVVAGTPEDEDRALERMQVRPGVVRDERASGVEGVRVQERTCEESFCGRRGERGRVGGAPVPEGGVAAGAAADDRLPVGRDPPSRLEESENHERDLRSARRRGDSRSSCEDDRGDGVGTEQGRADDDDASHRVADERRRQHPLALGHGEHAVGVRR